MVTAVRGDGSDHQSGYAHPCVQEILVGEGRDVFGAFEVGVGQVDEPEDDPEREDPSVVSEEVLLRIDALLKGR